jgi:asparagine synthase (glutamine-hydrolysing)
MCGIAGIAALSAGVPIDGARVECMVRSIVHRGPDGQGRYDGEGVVLGHARLSIIDLAGGAQPIHNEDQSVWVVFNGEIFNYIELRAELETRGHRFYTQSDTEVIVHAYEEYGEDFGAELNGQFAIALWDSRRRCLILMRDRAGILPLFFARDGDRLYFGSEVKALLAGMGRTARLDPQGLDQLLTFWSPVAPRTVFEGISELRPGEMLTLQDGHMRQRRYWDWRFSEPGAYRQGSTADLAEELHDLLVDATRIRLRADVPVGAYLSGGLDSSVLSALILNHGDARLRTFSIGFDDPALDETAYQAEMARHLGTEHTSMRCAHRDVAEHFPDTIAHTESPVLRTAPVPMGMLSGLVREQGFKVVLTGEGSDEVLGGYDIFKETKIRQFWARDPASELRPLLLKRLYPYLQTSQAQSLPYLRNFFGIGLQAPDLPHFSHLPRWATTARCKEFYAPDWAAALRDDALDALTAAMPAELPRWDSFNRAQYIEAKTLMGGYLLASQGDRMLMKHSIEGRFPFLDHRVIEYANGLDPRQKMHVLNEKYLLKQSMQRYLPSSIVRRHKQPYRAPDIASFFADGTPEYVHALMAPGALRRTGYFDADKVGRLMKKIERGRVLGYKDNMAFVAVLSTQLWHHQFVDGHALSAQGGAADPPPSSSRAVPVGVS